MNTACIDLFRKHLFRKFEPFTDAELVAFVLNPYHQNMDGKDAWNACVELGRQKLRELWQQQHEVDGQIEEVGEIQDAAMYGVEFTLNRQAFCGYDELDQFFKVVPNTANALVWWKQHAALFPTLALIARKYLNPKPSQIDSERDFSGIRLILTDLRNKLSPEKVHKLSVVRPFLHRHYYIPPSTRSDANRAADARRLETAASTRRTLAAAQFVDIPANPPVPLDGLPDRPIDVEDGAIYLEDLDDGERDSDDDYEADEEVEEFRQMEEQHFVPQVRASRHAGPMCRLYPVGSGIFQYIARFQNLPNGRNPPTAAKLFGPNTRLVSDFSRVTNGEDVHWLISVTDKAREMYTSAKQLMRTLGEIIQITDDMFAPDAPNPQ